MSSEDFEDLLCGRGHSRRYKNSNLVIINTKPKSVVERSKDDIAPPTKLNVDYYKKYSHPYAVLTGSKGSGGKKQKVDSEVLRRVLKYG